MTNKKLQNMANELYKKYFHRKLNIKVTFNKRLRTSAGRMGYRRNRLTGKTYSAYIDVNPKVISYDKSEPENTVKHELIHYYLYSTHQPCGHNIVFKSLASKLGCDVYMPQSWARRTQKPNSVYYIYQCKNCGNVMLRKRRIKNLKNYYCANKIKDNFGLKTTCHGKWKPRGKITVAQLQKKNNKVDRLKKNFKRKERNKAKYRNKLAHVLGYKDSFVCHATERSAIQGRMMNAELGKILPKLSSHARKQLIQVFNSQDDYMPQQAILKIKNKHFRKDDAFYDYVTKSAKKVIKQLKKSKWTLIGLELDTEAGMGWYLCCIDDIDFLNTIADFADENYTNGIKLYKTFINFMKKHNQDYKKVERKEKVVKTKA